VIDDLSDADAAEIMGISASSVKTHRSRGIESLRKVSLASTSLYTDSS
jgi:DNA-directed RNA polymerase specialized sigma24 family protein